MGGAQPLAVTMAGGVCICIEIDPHRIQRRLDTKYLDRATKNFDEAVRWAQDSLKKRKPLSIGLEGNAANLVAEFAKRHIIPDLVTDQTSAHDELIGYIPNHYTLDQANSLRETNPEAYIKEAYRAMGEHVQAILDLKKKGAVAFDYGNNLRAQAEKAGIKDAFSYPGFVPAYIPAALLRGKRSIQVGCPVRGS